MRLVPWFAARWLNLYKMYLRSALFNQHLSGWNVKRILVSTIWNFEECRGGTWGGGGVLLICVNINTMIYNNVVFFYGGSQKFSLKNFCYKAYFFVGWIRDGLQMVLFKMRCGVSIWYLQGADFVRQKVSNTFSLLLNFWKIKWINKIAHPIFSIVFTTAARWAVVVIESKNYLIDLPTFF